MKHFAFSTKYIIILYHIVHILIIAYKNYLWYNL